MEILFRAVQQVAERRNICSPDARPAFFVGGSQGVIMGKYVSAVGTEY